MEVINNIVENIGHLNALGFTILALCCVPLVPALFCYGYAVRQMSNGSGGDTGLSKALHEFIVFAAFATGTLFVAGSAIAVILLFGGNA